MFQDIYQSLHFLAGDVMRLPFLSLDQSSSGHVIENVERCIVVSKEDWDYQETSFDFRSNPLLEIDKTNDLGKRWKEWESRCCDRISELRQLEQKNNQIFIDNYSLGDVFESKVNDEEISLKKANQYEDISDLISYSVGCMFGRYALDKPGLILANQGETLSDYLKRVPEPSFPADEDNVIPMLDGDWFTDDISERFKQFLKVAFGADYYEENLRFVEESLNIKGKRNYSIRDYFLSEFYTDHVKRYKKRPIYWLFSSPKGSFNALIYMHRYRPDTVSVVLNDYLREFRTKLTAHKSHLDAVSISGSATQGEKSKALKEIEALRKIIEELDSYERDILYPLATEQLEIDLDDGVKANYPKFGAALKKIVGLDAAED